jgi:hypothetical protein
MTSSSEAVWTPVSTSLTRRIVIGHGTLQKRATHPAFHGFAFLSLSDIVDVNGNLNVKDTAFELAAQKKLGKYLPSG